MYTSEHWLLPWRLRKCLELLEEMQSNRLIPLRVQLHFEVAHCEANPWNFEFVHSTFNQILAIGCCAIAWNWYSTTLNNRTRFTWFTHWEVFFQTTLRILSPDGWSALIGQVASDLLTKGCGEFERANTLDYTVTEAELLDTAPWWKTLDGKQRELKYGLIWCWYRLWMDGLNGMLRNWLLRNSSLNINKIISLASFAIQQEQYCYIWHHSNMFETNKCNKMIQDVQKKNTWLRAQNLRWDPCWVKMLVHWDGILRIILDDSMKPQRTPLVVSPRNSLFPCFTTTKNPFIGYGFCMFKGIPVVTVVWKYLNDSSRRFQVLEKPCRMCLIVLDSLSNLGLPQDHLNLLHWKTNLYEDGTTHLGMLGGQVLNGRSQVFSCLMFLLTICKAEACLLRCQRSS